MTKEKETLFSDIHPTKIKTLVLYEEYFRFEDIVRARVLDRYRLYINKILKVP